MQLSMSNLSRGSSLRKRHASTRFAGSTTMNGSMASAFLSLILAPSWDSRTAIISAEVIMLILRRWVPLNDVNLALAGAAPCNEECSAAARFGDAYDFAAGREFPLFDS